MRIMILYLRDTVHSLSTYPAGDRPRKTYTLEYIVE